MARSDGTEPATATLSDFAGSVELMAALSSGPKHKPELASRLGVSKSTVYNRITELEAEGAIERTGAGYRLTQAGRLYAEILADAADRLSTVSRARPLLAEFPRDHLPPVEALAGAEIVTIEFDPDQPAAAVIERLERADEARGFYPYAPTRLVETVCDEIHADALVGEFVMEPALAQYVAGRLSPSAIEIVRSETASLLQTDASLPFGVTLFEGETTEMVIPVYSGHGNLCGLIVSSDEPALEWASSRYERYREDATPVPLDPANDDVPLDAE